MNLFRMTLVGIALLGLLVTEISRADDDYDVFMIYGIQSSLNMGNPGEKSIKDYMINMGAKHGLRKGQIVEALRKTPTYDLNAKKLHKESIFPIARLKVIHVDDSTAITRLETMYPEEVTPVISPRAVLVGDLIATRQK